MVETKDKKWYVIRAISGKELKLKDELVKELAFENLDQYIDDVLVPTERVIQIRNGKKINKEKVYYPGYVLVKSGDIEKVVSSIKSMNNVIGFLKESKTSEGLPTPLRPLEVSRLLGKVDELTMATEMVAIPFKLGQSVKVIDGPFNGFNGTIEKINEEKHKLEVMVKIFGRKTPLELSYLQVEKI
ncbi:MAG: transcription termination/antitermination protein NusG [Flavobacteriaceae bacterium]|nr:transcription termination/antitermination protein NusG [Flavobacteriaceae bacterium]MCY4215619.1 transcription termination/antitermination protein NusG [Flavobacteriaceae bacterium]MCY4254459.1 transcription termination/antitermination protein NusG [Flavobacteriaceae bacterium]